MANRIQLKGPFRQEEAVAGEAGIYPGMLLKLNSSGQVIKHATAGGLLGDETLVAMEDALQGKTVATVYTSGAIVTYCIPQKGSEVNLLVEAVADIAIAEKICSAGNGSVQGSTEIASGETLAHVVGVAVEANDLSGTGAVATLSAVRIV